MFEEAEFSLKQELREMLALAETCYDLADANRYPIGWLGLLRKRLQLLLDVVE